MSFNNLYNKVYHEILFLSGEFDVEKVFSIVVKNCPNNFTNSQKKMLSINVMNELLNAGFIKIVRDGVYINSLELIKRKNNSQNKEVCEYGNRY